ADDDDLKQQLFLECVDGPLDQLRTIVGRDHFHAFGEGRLDLLQLIFHPLDHVQGIFTGPHDDDAARRVPFAVKVGDAATDVGAKGYETQLLDQNRRALRVAPDDDFLDVRNALGVTTPPDHVLGTAKLDDAA